MTWPVHEGHPDADRCPYRHYWPHLGDTAERNWTNDMTAPSLTRDASVGTYAKIIEDSVSPEGHRLTTMEVRFHRFVLAEFNTHRVFSRNSASSRAIPLRKQIERLLAEPATPVAWPAEQSGMQGGEDLSEYARRQARHEWFKAGTDAAKSASRMHALGYEADERLHKSVANRLLEPFMWHTVVVTATDWGNFFEQRCSPLAQPEIRVAAEMMQAAYTASTPTSIDNGDWHLPYVEEQDIEAALAMSRGGLPVHAALARVSAARCARVSYLTQDGKRDLQADLDLYDRLVSAHPWHGSPLEHPATPWGSNVTRHDLTFKDASGLWQRAVRTSPRYGNLLGWRQLRLEVEAVQDNQPNFTPEDND